MNNDRHAQMLCGRLIPVAALLALAGTAVAQPAGGPAVIVTEARMDTVADRIDALGTARAAESVTVTSVVAEKIVELGFDDGQRVARGSVLARLDSSALEAELDRATITLAERRLTLTRTEKLAAQKLAPAEDLDLARLAVRQAEASVRAIETRIDKHVIRAPFDGVVGLRPVSVGAFVAPGEAITTLDDTATIKLDFPLPAVHLADLSPGQTFTATSSATGNRTYTGTIATIDARIDPGTRSVLVRGLVDNSDGALRPGSLMRVTVAGNAREAVVVPESALTSRGSAKRVYVVDDEGNAQQRNVNVGTRLPGLVEIVAGLTAGERVIIDGLQKVRPGQPVTVRAVDDGTRSLRELLSGTVAP